MRIHTRRHNGYTLLEVLTVIALIGIVLLLVAGIHGGRVSQKKLLYAARLFSDDVRAAMAVSRAKSETITLRIEADGYSILIDRPDPEQDELLFDRRMPKGVAVYSSVSLPESWGTVKILKSGDDLLFSSAGFQEQIVLACDSQLAPGYKTVLVRVYHSGDSQVYRANDDVEEKWIPAPLG